MISMPIAFWTLIASILVTAIGMSLMTGRVDSTKNKVGRSIMTAGLVTMWAAIMLVNVLTPTFDFALSFVLLTFAGIFHTREFTEY